MPPPKPATQRSPRPRNLAGPAFSPAALTDRVILLNDRRTVMRREPCEIPNGCATGLFFLMVQILGWKSQDVQI